MANRRQLLGFLAGTPLSLNKEVLADILTTPNMHNEDLCVAIPPDDDALNMSSNALYSKITTVMHQDLPTSYAFVEQKYTHMKSWNIHMKLLAQQQDKNKAAARDRAKFIELLTNPDKLAKALAETETRRYPNVAEYLKGTLKL